MNIWRPSKQIKVKTLGLVWKNSHLLASEVRNDDGALKGVRPLGGHVEFGETWQDALHREFQEELGVDVEVSNEPIFMENIFSHQNAVGHEYVILADVRLLSGTHQDQEEIEYLEDNGEKCVAKWFDLNELGNGGPDLFPSGLLELLKKR